MIVAAKAPKLIRRNPSVLQYVIQHNSWAFRGYAFDELQQLRIHAAARPKIVLAPGRGYRHMTDRLKLGHYPIGIRSSWGT
ncbi:MAG: hypothetical protein FJ029_13365 [Actinobacteria bacterium]|nr:hypothetical protein [Actinomycetota bacterium]